MDLNFIKMHGCGNDYIYFDCFEQQVENPGDLSIRLSDRHFGIGGDGIVLILPSEQADAKMRMFNADGSEGKMCGNAIRCVGKHLYECRGMEKEYITVETLSGIKTLKMEAQSGVVTSVRVDMGSPILTPAEIPVLLPGGTIVDHPLTVAGKDYQVTCVSMGNPHCVVFMKENVMDMDLPVLGPAFENHQVFPEQVNTEFINAIDDHTLVMRVWERGSGETWACGTGACAAAVAAVLTGRAQLHEDITVRLRGGDLVIRVTDDTVFMTGPAERVFIGTVSDG